MGTYDELTLVEKPAIELFESLGFSYLDCYHETFGDNSTLGRETNSEVVLKNRLTESLINLNPDIKPESLYLAVEEISRDRSSLNPVIANREIYKMLKDGVKVSTRNEDEEEVFETVKVIDFNNPENNDFFLASQFWVSGDMYKKRPDLVCFINGIPLVFIELKASHRRLENAYRDNLTDYKDTIPHIFWYNAFIILSNGSDSSIGSISSAYEHFNEWKKINSEGEEGIVSLDTIIRGTCEKTKLLDIIENFTLYNDSGGSLVKIISKNHQYLGVNNAIESFKKIKENQGKLGVFWHTQGSGKSFSMIFFSQKILRKFGGNYTFLIVTDRKELDDQIYKNFSGSGAVIEQEVHAESREHLKKLLTENHRNIFTLIHKFGTETGETYPQLSTRDDIIVITDEAHRSQYDTLAMNMRTALPNASFIAFTGTPLIVGEELTKQTFGDYISIYDFKQSVEDNATVPLYYENRIPEVQLLDKDLFSHEFEKIIEESILNEEQEKKLSREFARQYHIITRDDRLDKIAEDIVEHSVNRGYMGKAMVVSIDKPTTVKIYDKVQKHWKKYIDGYKERLRHATDIAEIDDLNFKIQHMEETDMAVVVSQEQNEIQRFKELGLDIETHRRRMVQEDLATKFKDPDNPFRIVFVCAMWMTGFDVQPLSTIYLDKPMKNHTLMQTIARANRVFKDKPNGLIVDYVGIFRNLQKALAIYGPSGGEGEGGKPVQPKEELVKQLEDAIKEFNNYAKAKEINIEEILEAEGFDKVNLRDKAVDKILVNDESKRKFQSIHSTIIKLYKAILPDKDAGRFNKICALLTNLNEKIKSLTPKDDDVSEAMGRIEKLLDESIEAEGYVIDAQTNLVDLSKIDFDELKKRFLNENKHMEAEKLRGAVNSKVKRMVRLNKLRINLSEKLQKLIDEYNSGSINVQTFFDELTNLVREVNEEDKRAISENLSEEELAIFDLLDKGDLSEAEKKEVKKASRTLLETLKKQKLVLDWRKRQQSRADVQVTIETVLDKELPRTYTPEIFKEKCDEVFHHVYDSYYGAERSVYEIQI